MLQIQELRARRDGELRGRGATHCSIEGINLTELCYRRLRRRETLLLGRTGASASFSVRLAARPGDLVAVRLRDSQGRVGPWATRRLPGHSARRYGVAAWRIGIEFARSSGQYRLFNISSARQIAEPGVTLVFTKQSDGSQWSTTLNDEGTFRGRPRVPWSAGDTVSIHVAGGPARRATLQVPVSANGSARGASARPMPRIASIGSSARHRHMWTLAQWSGQLFDGAPSWAHVVQGDLDDCYLAAAAAAVAHHRPDLIRSAFKARTRGTYQVRVFRYDPAQRKLRAQRVVVDDQFYLRSSGHLLYGSSRGSVHGSRRTHNVLWWPILEKACAVIKGGYRRLDAGGTPHHGLTMLTGSASSCRSVSARGSEHLWRAISAAVAGNIPMVASSHNTYAKLRFSRIMANHCYPMLSCGETRGRRIVHLVNPWGETTPPGARARDGTFSISWDQFLKCFVQVSFGCDARTLAKLSRES